MEEIRRVRTLLDAQQVDLAILKIFGQMMDELEDVLDRVVLVGIHTRGVPLAERLVKLIREKTGRAVLWGTVCTEFYDDQLRHIANHPLVKDFALPSELPRSPIFVLVDDVLYKGQTVLWTMTRLLIRVFNEPRDEDEEVRIMLAVLVNRTGWQNVAVTANFCGYEAERTLDFHVVHVHLTETDPEGDEVALMQVFKVKVAAV